MGKEAKKTEVTLVCPKWSYERAFTFEHAENLLKRQNNGGWELPKDSEYKMTENGLELRGNKENNKGRKKSK